MRPSHLRLGLRLRGTFYAVFTALFLSGLAWWIAQRASAGGDDFSPRAKIFATWLLRVHGAAAMLALVIFGILYPLHISRGWRSRRNRAWGGVLVGASAALVLTGYLLYYAASEELRGAASSAHLWIGLALPPLVFVHIWRGRRSR